MKHMSKFIPTTDSAFQNFVAEFVEYINRNSGNLQLSPEMLTVLGSSVRDWETACNESIQVQIQSRKNTLAKQSARKNLEKLLIDVKLRVANSPLIDES